MKEPTNDLQTKRTETALKLVNRILVTIGKEEIDDLLKFKHIDRKDITKPEVLQVVDEMLEEIYGCFDKSRCYAYKRGVIQHFQLSVLRGMCKQLGLNLKSIRKGNSVMVGNDLAVIYNVYYSIEN